jgi:hypothetical protein
MSNGETIPWMYPLEEESSPYIDSLIPSFRNLARGISMRLVADSMSFSVHRVNESFIIIIVFTGCECPEKWNEERMSNSFVDIELGGILNTIDEEKEDEDRLKGGQQ